MSEPRSVSRRTLSRGVAWSVPAVIVGTSATAMAVSTYTGCGTLLWTSTSLTGTQGTNGVRTGTLTLDSGRAVTVTATQRRISGRAGYDRGSNYTSPTAGHGDFSVATAGSQQASGNNLTRRQNDFYHVDTTTGFPSLVPPSRRLGQEARRTPMRSIALAPPAKHSPPRRQETTSALL